MGAFVMVGNAIYTAEDVAKLLDELCAAKLAVAPPLNRVIRADIAEGIAAAIEALDDRGYGMYQAAYDHAARVARGYTHTGQEQAT